MHFQNSPSGFDGYLYIGLQNLHDISTTANLDCSYRPFFLPSNFFAQHHPPNRPSILFSFLSLLFGMVYALTSWLDSDTPINIPSFSRLEKQFQ